MPPSSFASLTFTVGRSSRKGAAIAWARSVGDGLGQGLDPEMVRPVAAWRLLGIETTQSCWGHEESGTNYPWIDFPASPPEEIMEKLPSFHLVAKGAYGAQRMVPRTVAGITSDLRGDWSRERQELLDWAEQILGEN